MDFNSRYLKNLPCDTLGPEVMMKNDKAAEYWVDLPLVTRAEFSNMFIP